MVDVEVAPVAERESERWSGEKQRVKYLPPTTVDREVYSWAPGPWPVQLKAHPIFFILSIQLDNKPTTSTNTKQEPIKMRTIDKKL